MTSILDLLEDGAHERGTVRFLPSGECLTTAELWRQATAAALRHANQVSEGESIAMLLSSTPECVAALIGAWLAGVRVVSLPHPGRGMPADMYKAQLRRLLSLCEARVLLVDPEDAHLADGVDVPSLEYGRDERHASSAALSGAGSFVQFSSGSTGKPKGILLGLDALAANVAGILDRVEPPRPLVACSWLPLSHDMGLIGMLLGAWVSFSDRWSGGGELVLIDPRLFVTNPSVWLSSCAHFRAQITTAPNFAFELLSQRVGRGQLDLSALETCIVGAEPVRAATLRRFAAAAEPTGFRPTAFAPAYGLAEASLAVTMTAPGDVWRSVTVDAEGLAAGEWLPGGDEGLELVSAGRPLRDVSVRIDAPAGRIGRIMISSPALLSRYLTTDDDLDTMEAGWFSTKDLGIVRDGELYVAGRVDDLLFIAGRNIFATDLERHLVGFVGIRGDHSAVVSDGDERYVVVAERRPAARFDAVVEETCRSIRMMLVRVCGIGPSEVVLIAPGSFPKTPSGKVQRRLLTDRYARGQLEVEFRLTFGRNRHDELAIGDRE